MSWLSQALGLDPKPAPSYSSGSSGSSYQTYLDQLKKERELREYNASVQAAQQATSGNAAIAQAQRESYDAQQKANDISIASSQQYGVPGTGYNPEAARMSMYSSAGASPSTAADTAKKFAPAAYATSEQQNKTGSQANKFNLPNTQGLTFGGAY